MTNPNLHKILNGAQKTKRENLERLAEITKLELGFDKEGAYFEDVNTDILIDEQDQILSPEKEKLRKNLKGLKEKLSDAQDFIDVLEKLMNTNKEEKVND